jgi:hypothetical protein
MKKDIEKTVSKFKTPDELSEILTELKSKHSDKKMYKIAVPVDGATCTIFLKDLDRFTYKAGHSVVNDDELKGIEIFLKGMYLGGDDINLIIGNWRATISAGRQLTKLLKVEESSFSEV